MNKALLKTLKGFRDFLPKEARKRQYVVTTLRKVFESYGFEPLETPSLEYEEILMGKYGEEADKLMYRFTDNGERQVAMRYDQTVPLSRVYAQYQNDLPIPFKRYQIQPVWRADNTQKGRYREFLQCDIDIVGTSSFLADAEILAVIGECYKQLAFPNLKILINDRALFGNLPQRAITIIDKLRKIGEEGVLKELKEIGIKNEELAKILEAKPTENLLNIMKTAEELGLPENILQFSPTLARGLDYYTGIIIEAVCQNYPTGSLGGGGRYDNLIGMFLPVVKDGIPQTVPSVGFAVGFDRTLDAMEDLNLFSDFTKLSATRILVTIFNEELLDESIKLTSFMRNSGLNVELYNDPKAKLEKQIKYADKKSIQYVAVIGPDEIKDNTVTIKNLRVNDQQTVARTDLLKVI